MLQGIIGDEAKVELTTQMIKHQDRIDPAVAKVVSEMEKIVKLVKARPLKSSTAYEHNKDYVKSMTEIDKLLSKRFGLNVKHVLGNYIGYAVYTTPPVADSNINRSATDTFDWLNWVLEMHKSGKDDKMESHDRDYGTILDTWRKSFNALDDKLTKGKISIDLDKAYIKDIPKDYKTILIFDPIMLIKDCDLTASEIVAAMMHEIGHAFTHIEYTTRNLVNVSGLIDTMQETAGKEGSALRDVLDITYSKLGTDAKEQKAFGELNDSTAILAVIEREAEYSATLNSSNHAFTDSEALADRFSSRMGMEIHLATGLSKLGVKFREWNDTNWYTGNTYFTVLLFLLALPVMVYWTLLMLLVKLVDGISRGLMIDTQVYDNEKRRFARIRNELVNRLRNTTLSKDEVKAMIGELDEIKAIIDKTPEDKEGKISKIMTLLSSTRKDNKSMKEVNELIEDLVENELHVASKRLNTLV